MPQTTTTFNKTVLCHAVALALTLSGAVTTAAGGDLNFVAGTVGGTTQPPLGSGSWFAMKALDNGPIDGFPDTKLYTTITPHNGLSLGVVQAASGSHGYFPGCDPSSGDCTGAGGPGENPDIDSPWSFFGRTGMHQTTSPITILADNGASQLLDFSGWGVTWNTIANIAMGGDTSNFPSDTGQALMTCSSTCADGESFTLDYTAHVPIGDPSFFGGVVYDLHLEGTLGASQFTGPDFFKFTDQDGVATSTVFESDIITVSGLENATEGLSITGGEYSINGGPYSSGSGQVANGDTVRVRHTSAATDDTAVNTILTIGQIPDVFSTITTATTTDSTPAPFHIADRSGMSPHLPLLSISYIRPEGFTGPTTITEVSANNSSSGTIQSGWEYYASCDVSILLGFAETDGLVASTTVTIGGLIDILTCITQKDHHTPDAFSFIDQTDVSLSTLVTSNVSVSGTAGDTTMLATVSGGEAKMDVNGWFSGSSLVSVGNGSDGNHFSFGIWVRHTSSGIAGAATNTTVTLEGVDHHGNVSGQFTLTDTFTSTTDFNAIDTDNDGIGDDVDNCTNVTNGPLVLDAGGNSQLDTNSDGFGNLCDPDLDNSGFTNSLDLGIMGNVFFTADLDADLNGDGFVNSLDLGIMSNLFFQPPGPSGP